MRWNAIHLRLVLCVLCAIASCGRVFAWGWEGHRITGEIAAAYLSDEAKAAIAAILGEQTLADVANWADEARNQSEYEWTRPLHYINVPRAARTVDMKRDCETGLCVVGAIREFERKLCDPATPANERRDALRFLVHFVGDIHQPMHVSYLDDRGGNLITVTFLGDRDTNIHRVWDTGLLRRRMKTDNPSDLTKEIKAMITPELLQKWRESLDPVDWANESLVITRRIYTELPRGGVLGQEYYEHNSDDVLERLAMAGVRMAALLNDVYSPKPDPKVEEALQRAMAEEQRAIGALTIVGGDRCGAENGRMMHLLNAHGSRLIEARVKRSWRDREREMSAEETIVVRPGEANQRRLGCSHQQFGREVREFRWTIVGARFR